MTSKTTYDNATYNNAGIYDFRVLDDRDDVVSEMKLELLHPKEVLAMAAVVAGEITMSHPDLDCRHWSVEITAPSGTPFTSLLFNYIALYGAASGKRTCATPCAISSGTQPTAEERWRRPGRYTLQ